jgi:hypothetical protein
MKTNEMNNCHPVKTFSVVMEAQNLITGSRNIFITSQPAVVAIHLVSCAP